MPHLEAAGHSLSYERIEGEAGKPVLVFLHEGLGSIRQWREFPAKVCAATGCAGVVYDRYGYGQSDVLAEPRRTVRFMHDEALVSLPNLLTGLNIENPGLKITAEDLARISGTLSYEVTCGVADRMPRVFV